MLNNIKPNKAKNPYEMREKVLQDNSALLKKEKENEPDEFIVGLGLEQGNKKPAINKGIAAKRPEEEIFFKEEDFRYRDDDYKDEKWLNDFGKGLMEGISGLGETVNNQVTQNQARGKVANGQNGNSPNYKYDKSDPTGFMYRYNNLEDYYGTEGKNAYENAEKGMMNNLRSTLGEMGGRVAFLINDWLPNKNAQKILEENEAETYAKMSDDYFDLARAEAGKYGDKLVDFAEEFSEEAGYNLFGHKAGDIFKNADVGFKEYERLRQEGVDKELALLMSAAKSGFSFAQEKLLGYGQKWFRNNISKGNSFDFIADNDYNRANKEGDLVNEYHDMLTKQEWKQVYDYIARSGRLNARRGDRFVWTIDGIKFILEKVITGKDASDYQIIDYEILE